MPGALALTARHCLLLQACCVPLVLYHCCDYIDQVSCHNPLVNRRDVDCLDAYCGEGPSISKGFRRFSRKTLDFDILRKGTDNDVLSTSGFLKLLQQALRVRPDGFAGFGIPCGSYIFLNCPTHQRSAAQPFGNEDLRYIQIANQIGCRTALILLVLVCRACYIFIEQPSSSRLFMVPYFKFVQEMCKRFGIRFHSSFFWMGHYQHMCCKPSRGWGSAPWIKRLFLRMSVKLRKKLGLSSAGVTIKRKDPTTGKTTVSGGPKLKQTEQYPASFGRTVALRHLYGKDMKKGFLKSILDTACNNPESIQASKAPFDWSHADLEPIKQYLRSQAEAGMWQPRFSEGL